LPDLVGCNPSGTKKQVHIIPARKDWLSIAETIAARLRETAVAREHAAVPPLEISWLRDADLLTLLNPAQAGGDAAAFSDAFRVVRRLARADTRGHLDRAIVELSYLLSRSAFWRATEEQRARLVRQSVEQKWF
jgi:alkylation response protein AidB-like acyl-CoA dehydrogenase